MRPGQTLLICLLGGVNARHHRHRTVATHL